MAILHKKFLIFGYTLIVKIIYVTCYLICAWEDTTNVHCLNGMPDTTAATQDDCLSNCLNAGWCNAVDWYPKGVNSTGGCFFCTNTGVVSAVGSGITHSVYTCPQGQCNDTVLEVCIAPLSSARTRALDFTGPQALFVPFNQTDLQMICSLLYAADSCVHTTAKCSSLDTSVISKWKGINDSVSYLCGDGTAGLAQFQTCLTSSASPYQGYLANCIQSQPNYTHTSLTEDCRNINGRVNCYVTAAAIGCNSAEFVRTYFTKSQQPYFTVFNCIIGNETDDSSNNDLVQSQCNETALDVCIAPLSTPETALDFRGPQALQVPISQTDLQTLCSSLVTADFCVQSTAKCTRLDTSAIKKWKGINDSVSYLCGDGTPGLSQFQSCLTTSASTYQGYMSNCQQSVQPPSANPTDFCRYINDIFNCYVTAAAVGCNSAEFVKTYYIKSQQPSYDIYHCNLVFTGDGTGGSPTNATKGPRYCDLTKLTGCIALLNVQPGPFALTTNITDVSNFLDDVCRNFATAEACVQTSAGCSSSEYLVQVLWSGINDSTKYLCGDGQAGFRRYQQCQAASNYFTWNPEYIQNMTECSGYQNITGHATTQEICTSYNYLLRCYSNLARIYCDSGEFVSTYLYLNLQPVTKYIGCILDINGNGGITNNGQCNPSKIPECIALVKVDPLAVVSNVIYPDVSNFLEDLCRNLTTANACLQASASCAYADSFVQQLQWPSINDSTMYLCGDGQAGFRHHQQCLTDHPMASWQQSLTECTYFPVTPESSTINYICDWLNYIIRCYSAGARIYCDSEEFVSTYLYKYLQPLVGSIGCTLTKNGTGGSSNHDLGMDNCNSTALSECISPLTTWTTDYDFVQLNAIGKPINETFLLEVCSKLSVANNCIKTIAHCSSFDTEVQQHWEWAGVNDSVSYLCNEGKSALAQFQPCVTTNAQAYFRNIYVCVAPLANMTGISGPGIERDAVCRYYNYLFACYVNSARDNCNSAEFVMTYYVKSQQPTLNWIGCQLLVNTTGGSSNNGSTWVQPEQRFCDPTKLIACLKSLNPGPDPITFILNTVYPDVPNFLSNLCRNLTTANACIQTSTGCTSSDPIVQQSWSGINDSLTYLCGEGQAGFLRSQQCLAAKPYLITNLEYYSQNITECTGIPITDDPPTAQDSCKLYNFILRCYSAGARIYCDSGEFVSTYLYKYLQPVTVSIGCILNTVSVNSSNGFTTKPAVSISSSNGITTQQPAVSSISSNGIATQQPVVSASSSNGMTTQQQAVLVSSSSGITTQQPAITVTTTPPVVITTRQPILDTTIQSNTYVILTVQFKMKDKNFTSEFGNLKSEESMILNDAICKSFDEVLRNKTSKPMKLCHVLRYSQGSLVADTDLSFPPSPIADLQNQVAGAVNTDFANPNGTFRTNLNSVVASFQVTSSSPDQPTTSPPDLGTQTGAIVGGTVGGVALLVGVFAVVIFKIKSTGSILGSASESVSRSPASSLRSSPPGSIRMDEESFDGSCKATGQGFATRWNVTNWPFKYKYNGGNTGRFAYMK